MAESRFTRARGMLSRLGRIGSKERVFEREQFFPLPPERVFAPFAEAGNLQAITPPWLHFRIISELPIAMGEGAIIEYRLRLHGMPVHWRTVIETWEPPYRFTDVQAQGPFALWHHTHTFEAVEGGTLARDRVRYRVGFGPFGEVAHAVMVGRDVERIFDFRYEAILDLVTDEPAVKVSPEAASPPGDTRRQAMAIALGTASAVLIGVAVGIGRSRWRR